MLLKPTLDKPNQRAKKFNVKIVFSLIFDIHRYF